jgi:hypothetical protein
VHNNADTCVSTFRQSLHVFSKFYYFNYQDTEEKSLVTTADATFPELVTKVVSMVSAAYDTLTQFYNAAVSIEALVQAIVCFIYLLFVPFCLYFSFHLFVLVFTILDCLQDSRSRCRTTIQSYFVPICGQGG